MCVIEKYGGGSVEVESPESRLSLSDSSSTRPPCKLTPPSTSCLRDPPAPLAASLRSGGHAARENLDRAEAWDAFVVVCGLTATTSRWARGAADGGRVPKTAPADVVLILMSDTREVRFIADQIGVADAGEADTGLPFIKCIASATTAVRTASDGGDGAASASTIIERR